MKSMQYLRATFLDPSGSEMGCIDTSDSYSQRSIAAFKRGMKDDIRRGDYIIPGYAKVRFEGY